ncbi:hypothetical protein A3F00_05415 [Candidatus Daviesbacteria bacterium RIFCSPHIGHO2_12_FULL_37_11]|uniref:Uncharacterized protein n=1 Tax=Candidatus Daviesbacteria bacterium RIFCSPHIGHO2_12_FULL_37_11 TaxID=1797777 RepID=A0A1F5KC78_9BACT|nr:MAG: hypothetical protein A2769_00620 [Candidatus Daviesbacteria bacterium RIFCSPHIGHO2_01_FULL_37_27]OGE38488.1 MAG: hypothetical protein A3F00_05415 [Candidatus Daviesbacteria bacterium RIFCSPHIGHO2_12_FULL_37_11]OGE45703.1 MAG: hypothetical protein A3B39_05280 [Candidatus Daviesbacteria bacterium RIFCSPLOWO2_01_FULL_37_10]
MKGFSLLEVILAVALFLTLTTGSLTLIVHSYNSNRLGGEFSVASQFASEGIEAVKSIKNQAYANLVNSSGTGIDRAGSIWVFGGANDTFTHNSGDNFVRTIKVESVNRDGTPPDGNIVATGGTLDPDTKKITSTVTWNFNSARSESLNFVAYLSDWRKPIATGIEFIGSATSTGNNTTSGSFTLPSGWQSGDTAVFWWYTRTNTKTIILPATLTQKQQVNASGFGRIYVGYRVLQSGDSTFAWTSSSATNSTVIWGTSVFRGVDTTGDPFEAQSGAPGTFTNNSSPDPPAVITVTSNAVVLPVFGKNNDYSGITVPAGYTSAGSDSSAAGGDASAGVAYFKKATAGSEDPGAWSAAGASGDDGYVWTGVLKPI